MLNNNCPLKIISHDAPGEINSGNAINLVVIKGSPFTFRITNNNQNLDLRLIPFSSVLIYDQISQREVSFLKKTPLETKTNLGEDGSFIDLECRISVLSSQHEDMAFRINLIALNPENGLPLEPKIHLFTDPIRVVSKPEQGEKKKKKK